MQASSNPAAVEVTSLSKEFGGFAAVKNVSFRLRRGEVLGFLGPNGAGKSTTMKIITGYLRPTRGSVRVSGRDLERSPIEAKRQIGYLPEGAPAYAEMSAHTFLEFVARVRGFGRREGRRRAQAAIERANLGDVVHQPIETLSKGFKRRVGVAQAILHDPPILVLDEPTDGLDPNQKHEMRGLIRQMASDKAILISTHILEEVGAVCDRALIIARGRLVFDGTREQLARLSERHNAVKISFDSEIAPNYPVALRALDGVADVLADADRAELTVIAAGGRCIIQQVSRLVQRENWPLKSLYVESVQLDDVFRDITRSRPGAGAETSS